MKVRTYAESTTHELGRALASLLAPADVLLLSGDLGAGKTALVKGIAEGLGVREPITSPTFNILLVHPGTLPLYHMDLYRLENPEELEDIDYFGTLEADGVSCVEWGDRFSQAAPEEHLAVAISILGDNDRELLIEGAGARGQELAAQWMSAASLVSGLEVRP
ncbi:MAG: tRNA (adenosine(37)-N6)-threonylcarbamoyltransferase complex ATPase subunit type 1 TsaE [Actinobacteria bacterium]|nr:tRNA (adenosine(37)-N6)-threonylcarbamoyltransferase complex ATPase subunit type 1 TsaE [Actinomycetota bacterium]MCG2806884.1 tRNA (adenosine(37)-N6)-threonylcarbamoyltransferase complex ATPase subunit type 1 TsaE [Coriobacteriia bacterium]